MGSKVDKSGGKWQLMFRGSSFHTLDAKGRIIIPARFRDVIRADGSDGVMVSQMDSCLVGYPFDEWRKVEVKILAMSEKSEYMRRFRRIFIGGAFDCNCDKQDRILVPPSLRQYAGLDKDIVLVGVLNHFEIWSRDRWDNEHTSLEEDMKNVEVRNEIAGLGL